MNSKRGGAPQQKGTVFHMKERRVPRECLVARFERKTGGEKIIVYPVSDGQTAEHVVQVVSLYKGFIGCELALLADGIKTDHDGAPYNVRFRSETSKSGSARWRAGL